MITKIRLFVLIIFIGYVKGRYDLGFFNKGETIRPEESQNHRTTEETITGPFKINKDPGPEFDTTRPGPEPSIIKNPTDITWVTEATTLSAKVDSTETVTSIKGLSAEMKTNEIIEQKIIDAMNEFTSNCNIYNPISLSVQNFSSLTELTMSLGENKRARFHNFNISESNEENEEWNTRNLAIGCDPGNDVQIRVSLPTKLSIVADIEVLDSSDDVVEKGSISLNLRGISVSRNIRHRSIYNEPKIPEFSFEKSEVSLDIGMYYQLPIYQHLENFFDKLRPIQQFYSRQLRDELEKHNLSLSTSCSNVVKSTRNLGNEKSLDNKYVIPHVKLETWKGMTLSAGPILIEGLLNFNTAEFVATKYDPTARRANDALEDKAVKRIRTDNLKGRFEWKYRGQIDVLPFTIENIDFESIFTKKATIPSEKMTKSNPIKSSIHVRVGKVEIQPSQEKYCKNKNHFANFILSEYIQSVVADLLKDSMQKKFKNALSLQQCDNF